MAASVSSASTVTVDVSPVLTAAALTIIFATAPENLTRLQLTALFNYISGVIGGEVQGTVIGPLFVAGTSSASVSGSKTVTMDINPTHLAATLTTLFATAVEKLTYGNLLFIKHCCSCRAQGENPSIVIGSLFT